MRKSRPALFRGRRLADEIIALCVRWYLRFSLSYRNLEEIRAERNLAVDHTTVWRWVQGYAPELNRRVRCELKPTGGSWWVNETSITLAEGGKNSRKYLTPEQRTELAARPRRRGGGSHRKEND